MTTVDAVVVGAGHNGLVAANLLADAGWRVLVLEATDHPGGAVRTAELTAPGFANDLCSAFFPMSAASPVINGLGLDRYGLCWRHAPAALAHVLPDDRCALLSRDLDATMASVAAFAAEDAAAWERMAAQWRRIRDDLMPALLTPFPPVRPALRLLRALGTADALRLARMLTLPVSRFGEEQFAGAGARLLLAGNALHADLGVDEPGSAVFGWLLAMLAQDVGFPVPEGGAGRITDALVRRLTDRGGEVHCGRPVRQVLVAGGRALGVRDAGGEPVRARRAVLADVPAPALYLDLVGAEHLPARLVDDLRRFQWDDSTIKVDWALSGPVPWTAGEVAGAGTVHLGGDLDGLSRYGAELARGRVSEHPFLLLGQMNVADPTRSPAGTATVWAYTHVPQSSRWDRRALEDYAGRMERVVERHAPGFADRVLARRVQGPEDLREHDWSLVGGALNGGTAAIHQQLVFRPVPGLGRADTPVDRLYLAGASAHPGGAVHGGPGSNAARAALARDGLAGGLYARAVRAGHALVYGA
ncbi:Phytoene dehydrogenase-related protein [Amycolatopsis arida]|uniref:Pyridine nucleotide-disulfide oxidoreductase domain-containing protein 2 n=1 Tax=Amycolatopsis arida TaxID=587909 RepID=A0A1I5YEF6_9PSEU|nr:NAD(P)/FAD-dependent oxidoreductase [Amycolatopsis arida]TDX90452.1 phytoene dehydrogenase-like protein [Amycolatopsis arida]SFQ42500.1 Phytoene dehydrogenase-related protein [Amycolatopsis arida]